MTGLLNYTRHDLGQILKDNHVSVSHLKLLLKETYQRHNLKPFEAKLMPKKAHLLSPKHHVYQPVITNLEHSKDDNTIKFLLKFRDLKEVETVLIPEKNRLTLCISSQVGCRQKCVFCHTGKMGLKRNLSVEEITSQVLLINQWLQKNTAWLSKKNYPLNSQVSNVVFMGMGEPLDNIENLLPAISILKDPWALGIAPRRITVSTAGHLEGLEKLIKSRLNVSLALSLHASNNSLRSRLMPINKKFSMESVIEKMEDYAKTHKRKIFIQYTLFAGVNDSKEDALSLSNLLRNKPVKVNLIPFNELNFSTLKRPNIITIKNFQRILLNEGIRTTVRFSKGKDIQAACGQLISKTSDSTKKTCVM